MTKTEPKDVFLHLLAMVTLYASAISFLIAVFHLIDFYIADPLDIYNYGQSLAQGMRGSLSTLIIMFPAYLITMRFLGKSYDAEPEKRGLRIRKWLTYLTLFITAIIMLVDLIYLLNSFLGGEVTLRFLLKVVAVFFTAGSIFWYYFAEMKKVGASSSVVAAH
jgi:Domain of unknown function (DUF5671)